MSKTIIAILKKYATVPNQSKTKFFIPADQINKIATEIAGINKLMMIPPTLDQVKDYVKSKGYSEECAIKAFDYYTELDWIDANNKPVKNWKAKILAVWCKPEYKITIEQKESKSNNMVM